MTYRELVESVRRTAGLDTTEQAREALIAVLATCAQCLPECVRHRDAERLPELLEPAMDESGTPRPVDYIRAIAEVGWRLELSPERAHDLIQAVFYALRLQDPDLVADLATHLRADVAELLTAEMPPGGVPAPAESPGARRSSFRAAAGDDGGYAEHADRSGNRPL